MFARAIRFTPAELLTLPQDVWLAGRSSGTSIGANIHEAQYAQGKKDFISKLEIALKEASETGYWLELAYRTNYIDAQQYKILSDKCATLRVMLVSSCRTAKSNIDNK